MSGNEKKHPIRKLGIGALAVVAIIGGCSAITSSGGDDAAQSPASSATQTQEQKVAEQKKAPASSTAPKSSSHLTFKVTSETAKTADVTITYDNGKGGQVQKQETVQLPWTKKIDYKRFTIKPSGSNIVAQAAEGGTDIKASVTWNDDEPSTSEGSGEYATASAVLQ